MSATDSTLRRTFNPLNRGTEDSVWRAELELGSVLAIPDKHSLLIVSPHPDDEVLGAGGLIYSATRAGVRVIVLSVTDGEAAYPDWSGLDRVRQREVKDALRILAPKNIAINHLQIPDGCIGENGLMLFDAIDRMVSRNTLLVAPFERDGHPDHEAAGDICVRVAQLRSVPLWRYPVWTWHHSVPHDLAGHVWGRLPLDATAIDAKAQALRCFRSQMRPVGRQPIVPAHVLPYFERPYEAFLV